VSRDVVALYEAAVSPESISDVFTVCSEQELLARDLCYVTDAPSWIFTTLTVLARLSDMYATYHHLLNIHVDDTHLHLFNHNYSAELQQVLSTQLRNMYFGLTAHKSKDSRVVETMLN